MSSENTGLPEVVALMRELNAQAASIAPAARRRPRRVDLRIASRRVERTFARKRLLSAAGFVATILAVFSLTTGVTLARLSATTTSPNGTLTAGTVSFSNTATVTCTANSGFTPGSSLNNCQLAITYNGSAQGHVGLDVLIITDPRTPGASPLYAGNSGGLTFTLSDGTSSFTIPATAITGAPCIALGGDANATCYQALDELAEVTSPGGDATHTTWNNGDGATFTLTPSFPANIGAGDFSGSTARVTMTAHATQAGNNAIPGGCSVGNSCTGLAWV